MNTPVSVQDPLPFGDRHYERLGRLPTEVRKAIDDAIGNIYQVVEAAIKPALDAEHCDGDQIEDTIDDVIMEAMIRNLSIGVEKCPPLPPESASNFDPPV